MASKRGIARTKSSQACERCRKSKTRCEPKLEGGPCHRCGVLLLDCSFGDAQNNDETESAPSKLVQFSHQFKEPDGPADEPLSAAELLPPFDSQAWPLIPYKTSRWTIQPIFTMQRMVRQVPEMYIPPHSATTLSTILTETQITFLLNLYDVHYAPWLNEPIGKHKHTDAVVVTLTKCTIASRHPKSPYKTLYRRLSALTEYILREAMHAAFPAQDTIYAISLIGSWPTPIMRDGYRRASLALSMSLSVCTFYADADAQPINDGMPRAEDLDSISNKIWHGLLNSDCISCLGTRRPPLRRRKETDYSQIVVTLPLSSVAAARDVRLGLVGMTCDLCLECLDVTCGKGAVAVQEYVTAVVAVMEKMTAMRNHCIRLTAPLQAERFHSQVVLIFLEFCRLLAAWTFLREIRRALQAPDTNFSNLPTGIEQFVADLAKCASGHALLVIEDMNAAGPDNLSSAPDTFFAMIAFAATTMICFACARLCDPNPEKGPSFVPEEALRSLSTMLITLGGAGERCGILIGDLLQAWVNRSAESALRDMWASSPGPLVILHAFSIPTLKPPPAAADDVFSFDMFLRSSSLDGTRDAAIEQMLGLYSDILPHDPASNMS